MREEATRGPLGPGSERLVLGALLVAAGLVRWLRWERTDVLFADGPRFLAIAKSVAAHDWNAVLSDDFHPLYPAAVAGMHGLLPDWESAAVAVSIAGGLLAVACLYGLVRSAFDPGTAWVAAALLAFHTRAVEFTSDVQSEGLYLGCFLAAIWAAWRALEGRSLRWAALAGGFSGLAYLTRPEGLGVVGVAGLVALFEVLRGRRPFGRSVGWCAALVAGALLVVSPYLAGMSQQAGELTLTRKKSLARMVGLGHDHSFAARTVAPSAPLPPLLDPALPPSHRAPKGVLPAVWQTLRKALKAIRHEGLLLIVIGLWASRGRPALRGRFFAALVGAYALLLFGLMMSAGYVSRRHWLPVLVPLLGYGAVGAHVLGRWVVERLRRRAWPAWAPAAIGLAVVVVPLLVSMVSIRESKHLADRLAGERIAALSPGVVVASPRSYAAYYGQGRHLPIQASADTLDPKRLRERGVRYAVVPAHDLDPAAWDAVLAKPGLRLVDRFAANGREALLIEVEDVGARDLR